MSRTKRGRGKAWNTLGADKAYRLMKRKHRRKQRQKLKRDPEALPMKLDPWIVE